MGPRIVDVEAMRQRILLAGAAVFARKGYHQATMAEVAELAEVAKGSIYQYFDSKQALFVALCKQFIREFSSRFEDIAEGQGTPLERLKTMWDLTMTAMVEDRQMFTLMVTFWGETRSDELSAFFAAQYPQFRRMLADLMAQGVACGELRAGIDLEAVASCFMALGDGLFLQMYFEQELDFTAIGTGIWQTLLKGIESR